MVARLLALLGLAPDPQPAPEKPKRKRTRRDWRDEAVKRAAERHGKPFECGPDGVPREVLLGTESTRTVVVKDAAQDATVTQLKRKAKA